VRILKRRGREEEKNEDEEKGKDYEKVEDRYIER
jgi:hypothetical protein